MVFTSSFRARAVRGRRMDLCIFVAVNGMTGFPCLGSITDAKDAFTGKYSFGLFSRTSLLCPSYCYVHGSSCVLRGLKKKKEDMIEIIWHLMDTKARQMKR